MSFVSVLNGLALGTAFIASWLCLQSEYEKYLIVLNYYFISHSIAIILDASIMLRLERILSMSGISRGLSVFQSTISNYIFYFIFIVFFSFIELEFLNFSFLMVAFTRHLSNISKNCFPHVHAAQNFRYYSNIIAILRNLAIVFAIYKSSSINNFSIVLVYICILESLMILVIANYIAGGHKKISIAHRIFNIYRVFSSIIKRSQGHYSIINFIVTSYDRILIGMLFPEFVQVVYFKFKVLQQLVDGFMGVFSYRIRLLIMKSANIVSYKTMLLPASACMIICPVIWIYGNDSVNKISFIYLFLLIFAFILKRIVESLVPIYIMRMNGYSFLVIKNLIEVMLLCLVLVAFYFLNFTSIQSVFIINAYIACFTLFIYKYWFYKVD